MAKIIWTEEAVTWLQEIYEYIALDSPTRAANTVNRIREKVQILRKFPNIGYKYSNYPEGNIRIMLYGHYRIAYLIEQESIYILGVFHGALDIERYL